MHCPALSAWGPPTVALDPPLGHTRTQGRDWPSSGRTALGEGVAVSFHHHPSWPQAVHQLC